MGGYNTSPDAVAQIRAMDSRLRLLEQQQIGKALPGKTYTDANQSNVTEAFGGVERQGAEFAIRLPPNAFLGVYMRSVITNPGTGSDLAYAGVTLRFAPGAHPSGNAAEFYVFQPLLRLEAGPGTAEVFSVPGNNNGVRSSYGGIVILDDGVGPPDPAMMVSDQQQEFQIGFGYARTAVSAAMSFANNRMSLFYL